MIQFSVSKNLSFPLKIECHIVDERHDWKTLVGEKKETNNLQCYSFRDVKWSFCKGDKGENDPRFFIISNKYLEWVLAVSIVACGEAW